MNDAFIITKSANNFRYLSICCIYKDRVMLFLENLEMEVESIDIIVKSFLTNSLLSDYILS